MLLKPALKIAGCLSVGAAAALLRAALPGSSGVVDIALGIAANFGFEFCKGIAKSYVDSVTNIDKRNLINRAVRRSQLRGLRHACPC